MTLTSQTGTESASSLHCNTYGFFLLKKTNSFCKETETTWLKPDQDHTFPHAPRHTLKHLLYISHDSGADKNNSSSLHSSPV